MKLLSIKELDKKDVKIMIGTTVGGFVFGSIFFRPIHNDSESRKKLFARQLAGAATGLFMSYLFACYKKTSIKK